MLLVAGARGALIDARTLTYNKRFYALPVDGGSGAWGGGGEDGSDEETASREGGRVLDATDRERILCNVRDSVGDVRSGESVGHVAFTSNCDVRRLLSVRPYT